MHNFAKELTLSVVQAFTHISGMTVIMEALKTTVNKITDQVVGEIMTKELDLVHTTPQAPRRKTTNLDPPKAQEEMPCRPSPPAPRHTSFDKQDPPDV